ncbi:hypothetical protein GCM10027060_26560 [Nesterenkonia halophila]
MAVSDKTEKRPATYGNWRRPQSAGLLGLGTIGTAGLFAALIVLVLMVMLVGLLEAIIAAVVLGLVLLGMLTKDRHGRSVIGRISIRVGWWWARQRGQHLYRSGPLGRAEWGTYQLPGLSAGMRLREYKDSYERPFALIYTPATTTYTVVIGTEPDGAALVDQEQIDAWVADWGHWLANLSDEPSIRAASVTIETAPDPGTRLRREVLANVDPQAPQFAQDVLRETVDLYPVGSSHVHAYIALTFSASSRSGSRKRQFDEMGRELASRLPGLTGDLQATGAGAASPLTAQDLCEVVRTAYDPAVAPLIEEAHANGEDPDLSWSDVGPAAAEASWEGYRHDSAFSCSWGMTEAPRGVVQANILTKLLQPQSDIARKRVTLLYRTIDPARAAALVEADLNAAQFVSGAEKGGPSARQTRAFKAAQATADEEAAGAGLVNFGMVVTATVTDIEKVADARAAIDNLGGASRVRLRPAYGTQDSAFAAGLPLGLVLPNHTKMPAEWREKL